MPKKKKKGETRRKKTASKQTKRKPNVPAFVPTPATIHRPVDMNHSEVSAVPATAETPKDNSETSIATKAIGIEQKQLLFNGILAACGVVAVAVSAIQAFSSYWQWEASRDQYSAMIEQNDLARGQLKQVESTMELMRVEQRAWLSVSGPVVDTPVAGTPASAAISVKNHGATPATITYCDGAVSLETDENMLKVMHANLAPITKNPSFKPSSRLESSIAPGETKTIQVLGERKITADDAAAIGQGTMLIVVAGHLRYNDVFGNEHTTRWWLRYDPVKKKFETEAASGNQMD